jgi:DNA-directed RNA polymerase subunit omega
MLVKPPMEKLLPKADNRYVLAMLVAKRARQLVNGAQPLSQSESPNLVTVACEELGSNRVACVHGHVNAYIPLRPEIEAARLAAQAAAEQASTADAIKEELDKVSSAQPAPEADDAVLIGEALMNLEPAQQTDSSEENSDENQEENSTNDDDDNAEEITAAAGEAFPFKLAPPMEAADFVNHNFNQEAEEEE